MQVQCASWNGTDPKGQGMREKGRQGAIGHDLLNAGEARAGEVGSMLNVSKEK